MLCPVAESMMLMVLASAPFPPKRPEKIIPNKIIERNRKDIVRFIPDIPFPKRAYDARLFLKFLPKQKREMQKCELTRVYDRLRPYDRD
jgi:hypothetical protein